MIGLYIWLLCITAIIVGAFYSIFKKVGRNSPYKYSVNIHKGGFKKTKFPMIKLRIRGKYRYFLVDTGANVNLMDLESYGEIVGDGQVKQVDNGAVAGLGSEESVHAAIVEEDIVIAREKFTEEFLINDQWKFSREQIVKGSGINVVGILGSGFFERAKWMIDFENLIIWAKK